MRALVFLGLLSLSLSACDPGGGGDGPLRDGGGDGFVDDDRDTDGDGIADASEGRAERTDTDGDGTPDYQDEDSDGDGIPDSVEAGDEELSTPPRDSDRDGTPDFQDTDSDDNLIPDSDEETGDTDGDGIPDYADIDDDNDRARDLQELESGGPSRDTDGDGLVDFKDPDRDDDFIRDGEEQSIDTDEDGIPDWEDLDSDGDGWSDADEAGDEDVFTDAVDTDEDGTPDFQDPDSDNDGISDAAERDEGTDRTLSDTDGDGISDLIELGAGTDPLDGMDNPRTRGDFVFVIPFEEAPMPERDTLEFKTSIQFADVYFLFDISGSMSGEISALRAAVGDVVTNLTCMDTGTACMGDDECTGGNVCSPFSGTCIEDPVTSSCVASVFTGAAYYEDRYWHTGGGEGDGVRLQPDPSVTATTMAAWDTFGGTEELYQALWGVADPGAPNAVGCETLVAGEIGCPAFRDEAVRIVVAFTDEDSDGGETAAQAGNALMAAGITMIGVNSGSSGSRSDLVAVANASGSLDRTGAPLVYDGADAAVVPAVTTAINEIVEGVPLRVTIEAAEVDGDDGDALRFIDFLEVNTSGTGACTMVTDTEDAGWGVPGSESDGNDDAFPSLTPGTGVCWDVVPIMNDIQEPALTPLVYEAELTVFGDGSPLDSRKIFFLIPPRIEVGPPIE